MDQRLACSLAVLFAGATQWTLVAHGACWTEPVWKQHEPKEGRSSDGTDWWTFCKVILSMV